MSGAVAVAQEGVIDSMEAATFKLPAEKGQVEVVEGQANKALRFSFPDDCKSVFATRPARATPEWDKAAGFSFWVKGDGSARGGGLQLIWGEDYSLRYDYAFPIERTDWQKITVAWRDFIPVLPTPDSTPLGSDAGNAPSNVTQLWFGKWWYWREVGAHSFAVDDIRLERTIAFDTTDYTPPGSPLARVAEKLKARRPITIVTMGDSLTDAKHWTNQTTNWPALLQAKIHERFGSEVTMVNPAIGGTQLRQNLVLVPLWTQTTPAPDLVTLCFGYNDWGAGMRGPMFLDAQKDAVERLRRATGGKADILLMTPARALSRWSQMSALGEATRQAARATNAGLVDLEAAFDRVSIAERAGLFVADKVHVSLAGQQLMAEAVLDALITATP